MIGPLRRRLGALVLTVALLPDLAQAQTRAQSFDELQKVLKAGDIVIVIDKTGQEKKGRVAEVSATSLVLRVIVRATRPDGVVTWEDMEKFSLAADGVAAILRSDLEQTRGTEVYRVLDLFSDMSRHLKAGQIVEVTDHTGQKTTGKVAEVSPTSLVILTRERVRDSAGTEHDAWTGKQTHVPSAVRRVRRPGPVWDGALKGFGIALVVPLIVSASGVDTGADAFLTFGAMGAGIGLGIDALVGPATVYELSQPVRSVVFRPLFGKSRGGVMAVLRF